MVFSKILLREAECFFDVLELQVHRGVAAVGEVPGGGRQIDNVTFRFGFRAGDKLVVHHIGSNFGTWAGNGRVAIKNKDVVRVKLQEQFEGRLVAVVGIGVLSNVLEAEFIADQGCCPRG